VFETNAIAALKHIVPKIVGRCQEKTVRSSTDILWQSFCDLNRGIQASRNLAEIKMSFEEMQQNYLAAMTALIAGYQKELAANADESRRSTLEYQLKRAQDELKTYGALKVTGTDAKVGLRLPFSESGSSSENAYQFVLVVEISVDKVSAEVELTAEVKESLYLQYKSTVQAWVESLASADVATVRQMASIASGYLDFLGEMIQN